MLRISVGPPRGTYCDRVSRRSFLQVGGLAVGGLTLAQLLAAEGQAHPATRGELTGGGAGATRPKSLIMVFLPGGPPHQDMFELKTNAPVEIRGEFRPIATKVPGIEICELLPGIAQRMDRLALIRTVVGAKDRHESFQCMTGRLNENQPSGGWPEIGSVISRMQGGGTGAVPPFIGLSPKMQHRPYNSGNPGFLGRAHAPFEPNGQGRSDLSLSEISVQRLDARRELLGGLDRYRRWADQLGEYSGADRIQQQALGILTSSRLAEALDLERESAAVRERYGEGTPQIQGDAAARLNQQFLLARRLVEAGVRCVTLSYSFWDWHGDNFGNARRNLPDLDRAVSALVDDLHERGMSDDVAVIVWGEFGRTPRINKDGGRDHWPAVSCALLAGGGLKMGQAIGVTDRWGGEPADRPVHFQEIFATLYRALGIDPHAVTLPDLAGRPQYLVDLNYQPLSELI